MKKEKFKPGDIFSIGLENGEYAFGRCLSAVYYGHMVEVFNYFSKTPQFDTGITEERLFEPMPVDSFSLFQKRDKTGNWKVLSEDVNFSPKNVDHLRYHGMAASTVDKTMLVNVYGQPVGEMSKSEIAKGVHPVGRHFFIEGYEGLVFLLYSPWNDFVVRKEIDKYRNKA